MDEHIKFTMGILFMNICITLIMPGVILGDNYLYTKDSLGNYQLNGAFNNSMSSPTNQQSGISKGSIGLTDIFTLIKDFIVLTFKIFFSSIILIAYFDGVWKLVIGLPIILLYGFAVMRWLK